MKPELFHELAGAIFGRAWKIEPAVFEAVWGAHVEKLTDAQALAILKAHAEVSPWPPSLAEFIARARSVVPASGGPACERCRKRLPDSGRCDCPEPAPGAASANGWKLDELPQAGWPTRHAARAEAPRLLKEAR